MSIDEEANEKGTPESKELESLAQLLANDDQSIVQQGFELLDALEQAELYQAVVDNSLLDPFLESLFPAVIDPWEAVGPLRELKAEAWGEDVLGQFLRSDDLSTANEQGAGNWRELALIEMGGFFVVVLRQGVLEYADAEITGSHTREVHLTREEAEASYELLYDGNLTLETEAPFLDQPHMAPTWIRETLKSMETEKATPAFIETLERVAEVAEQVSELWRTWDPLLCQDANFSGQEEAYYGPRAFYPEAQLSGLNFSGADLSRAHLVGADLSGCNLAGAQLRQANLCAATLKGSDLTEADFGKGSVSQCAWYDGATQWPDGFDPADHEGLKIFDWAFFRQARALQTEMFLGDNSWDWNEAWQARLLGCVGLDLPEAGPVPLPPAMANAYEAASFYFNENLPDRGKIVADTEVSLPSPALPKAGPLAERLDLEHLQAERECWSRMMNPLEHVAWFLPDAIVHDVTSYGDCVTDRGDWLQDCSALLQVGDEWLVMGLCVSFGGYCDVNFDGYGALSLEIHGSREAAEAHLTKRLRGERNIRLPDDILFWNHGPRLPAWTWCDRMVAPDGVQWRSETLRQYLLANRQTVAEDYQLLAQDLRAFAQSIAAKLPA